MELMTVLVASLAAALGLCVVLLLRRERGFHQMRQEAREMEQSQAQLRDFALGQLLKGNVPDFSRIEDFYRVYHLEFPAEAFMLLVVKLRACPAAEEPGGQEDAYATVREELTGILGLYRELCFVEKEGLLVCFYCEPGVTIRPPSNNQGALRELLYQQCRACAAALYEKHGIDVIIALGQYDMGGFALHTNYISTKALLEMAVCSHWEENVVRSDEELTQKTDVELSTAQRQFYNCFVCFQYEDAAEYLFHMVELRIRNYYDPYPEAREVVAEQMRFCMNMLELPLNIMLNLPDGSAISMRDLMASSDLPALHENLLRYFSGLEAHVSDQGSQAAPAVRRVHEYIEGHFADPNISVSSLGEKFRLNVSYLSRQFKREYGYGVLECIHKARISRAKELMAQGMALEDVAVQVGYPSRRALDSAFSRCEGITPRAYQKQLPA